MLLAGNRMPKIRSLKPGENYCYLYLNKEEADLFLYSYFKQGLDKNEKSFYVNPDHNDHAFIRLLEEGGIDVDEARKTGKFLLANIDKKTEISTILKDHISATESSSETVFRIAVDDTESLKKIDRKWFLHISDDLGHIVNERSLSVFMYCMDRISPEALFHILAVFPSLIMGDEIYENLLFNDPAITQRDEAGMVNAAHLLDLIKDHKKLKDMLKRGGEALRASEQNYLSIFESVANLIAKIDKKGIIIDCNGKIKEVLGYDKDEIIGKSVAALFHPHDLHKVQETVKEVIKKGVSYDKQYEMVKKDGSTVVVSVNSTPLKNEKGKITEVVSIVEDITERKRVEEALLQSEKRYRQLVDMLPDAILTLNEGRIIFANAAAYDLLGLVHPRELIGRRMQELFDEKGAIQFNQCLEKILQYGKSLDPIRLETTRPGGNAISIEWMGMVLDRTDGHAVMFMGKRSHP
ncbi:MAG: sensory transduction histidine kinase [Deltaproteobacteria bacterium]|nr:sensory transduction histidine kinase [Deltaproteobacteria bacterium]